MWGGRFERGPSTIMKEITPSIDFDKRLWRQDIAGSRAHARMLAAQKIISEADRDAILSGLDMIWKEIEGDRFVFRRELEDIHLNIEVASDGDRGRSSGAVAHRTLPQRPGRDRFPALGSRCVHRSRCSNTCRMCSVRCWKQADAHAATIMPGFTHMQPAQPIMFAHHCLAYVEMFARDRERFADVAKRLNESPLGAAALAGTSFPIDRYASAEGIGFCAANAQLA